MSEKTVCPRCGYVGPEDARYCARCGRSLLSLSARSARTVNRVLDNASPPFVALLGLVALFGISQLAHYYIVMTGLLFPWSYALLVLVLAVGGGYLGWLWEMQLPNRYRVLRVLLVFAGMALLLVMVWYLDRAVLSLLADSNRTIVMDIPGLHLEGSGGYERRIIVSDAPPYWFFALLFVILVGVTGNTIHKLSKRG